MSIPAILTILIIAILGILIISLKTLKNKPKTFPYEKTPLLSPAELSFYQALKEITQNQLTIMTKVRLEDIINVKKGLNQSERTTARNRINSKHIDFVLCNPQNLDIVCTIELDDNSHNKDNRQVRDNFVDNALKSTGIKIIRIPVQKEYNHDEIKNLMNNLPLTGANR